MTARPTLLASGFLLVLAGCGDPAPTPPAGGPVPESTSTPAAPAAAVEPAANGGTEPSTDTACAVEIEGNDLMQFNRDAIAVPATCERFTITLRHTGQMPVATMGHNVVITRESDMPAVAADGVGAGLDAGYLKPGDDRILAHSDLVGGGAITSVTFPSAKLKEGGPYVFFCSFPGHAPMMNGRIALE